MSGEVPPIPEMSSGHRYSGLNEDSADIEHVNLDRGIEYLAEPASSKDFASSSVGRELATGALRLVDAQVPGETDAPDLAPGVPDIRLPGSQVAALTVGQICTYVEIDVPEMEPLVLQRLTQRIWDGIGDRGACTRWTPTRIRAAYFTAEISESSMADARRYAEKVARFLRVPSSAITRCTVESVKGRVPPPSQYRGLFAVT